MQTQPEILLITDTIENQLPAYYFDLIGFAARLAQLQPMPAQMLIASSDGLPSRLPVPRDCALELINLRHASFIHPHPALLSLEVSKMITAPFPRLICLPHTMRGCQVAAELALNLDAALITGVEKITNKNNQLIFHRSVMNGKWIAQMVPKQATCVLTVNQGAFAATAPEDLPVDTAKIILKEVRSDSKDFRSLALSRRETSENPIEKAEVVVATGRGLQNADDLEIIQATAALFKNAAIGASRPICDLGWLPYSHQIGETGKQIAPKFYIACGISGANQHVNGIKQAQNILAINTDPQAAIFRIADYGVIARLEDFLPLLVEKWTRIQKGDLAPADSGEA